jgi:hypothetical protein
MIELKNVRMPIGQRFIVAPPGSQIPAQKSLSDPGTGMASRTLNGVTLANGLKRTFPQPGIRLVTASTSNVITLPQQNSEPKIVTSPASAAPEPMVVSTSGVHISPALLKTLQTINQTKMVSGEREKLLSVVSKRVQLQVSILSNF